MSEPAIHVFNQRAMATNFQIRIAGPEKIYAAQTAQAAFALMGQMESHLSRFRANSDIAQIGQLMPGEILRISEPVFACLQIAHQMEIATSGAFSVTADALKTQSALPQWTLLPATFSIRCDSGTLAFDLGAIGKGFALDRMAELLREWECAEFLLVAGGSSILAGDPPSDAAGWSCGLGDDHSPQRYWLKHASLSGSGLAVQGAHILDPRTGRPAQRQNRAWAWATSAAESDALSTACMVMDKTEISRLLQNRDNWCVWLHEGNEWNEYGSQVPTRIQSV